MPLQFTLRYKDRLTDVDDVSGDRAWQPGMGRLLIEPVFENAGARIPFGMDIGYCPLTVEAWVDTDGELKGARGGTVGVRLDANDPGFNLPRLQYRVTAPDGLTDALGRWTPWPAIHFDAPKIDTVRYLRDYIPKPGQKFGRGPGASLAGFSISEDGLSLENQDGSIVGPVGLQPGVVIVTGNPDGTLSIGVG